MYILLTILRISKRLFMISLLLNSLSSIWFISAWASDQAKLDPVDTLQPVSSEVLDGLTFIGKHGPKGKPADAKDTFAFKDGEFVSQEGEAMCKSPACPYFIRHVGNTIEFISETICPEKNARIVWRGTVDGETIKGVFHWTSKRWYWTIEKDFWFEGTLIENAAPIGGSL